MKDEVFDVEFDYKGNHYKVTVKADLPIGPEPFGSDYDIYIENRHRYTINQCKNEDKVECWEVKKRPKTGNDPGFAQAIGKAIDKYYQ
jgi:hypothetical protein